VVTSWLTALLGYSLFLSMGWLTGSGLFYQFGTKLLTSGGAGRTLLGVSGVCGLLALIGLGIAVWTNKYFQYGYKGLTVYRSLVRPMPLKGARIVYLLLSTLMGGWWGAAGAVAFAGLSYLVR